MTKKKRRKTPAEMEEEEETDRTDILWQHKVCNNILIYLIITGVNYGKYF